jgi:hypothetical protein
VAELAAQVRQQAEALAAAEATILELQAIIQDLQQQLLSATAQQGRHVQVASQRPDISGSHMAGSTLGPDHSAQEATSSMSSQAEVATSTNSYARKAQLRARPRPPVVTTSAAQGTTSAVQDATHLSGLVATDARPTASGAASAGPSANSAYSIAPHAVGGKAPRSAVRQAYAAVGNTSTTDPSLTPTSNYTLSSTQRAVSPGPRISPRRTPSGSGVLSGAAAAALLPLSPIKDTNDLHALQADIRALKGKLSLQLALIQRLGRDTQGGDQQQLKEEEEDGQVTESGRDRATELAALKQGLAELQARLQRRLSQLQELVARHVHSSTTDVDAAEGRTAAPCLATGRSGRGVSPSASRTTSSRGASAPPVRSPFSSDPGDMQAVDPAIVRVQGSRQRQNAYRASRSVGRGRGGAGGRSPTPGQYNRPGQHYTGGLTTSMTSLMHQAGALHNGITGESPGASPHPLAVPKFLSPLKPSPAALRIQQRLALQQQHAQPQASKHQHRPVPPGPLQRPGLLHVEQQAPGNTGIADEVPYTPQGAPQQHGADQAAQQRGALALIPPTPGMLNPGTSGDGHQHHKSGASTTAGGTTADHSPDSAGPSVLTALESQAEPRELLATVRKGTPAPGTARRGVSAAGAASNGLGGASPPDGDKPDSNSPLPAQGLLHRLEQEAVSSIPENQAASAAGPLMQPKDTQGAAAVSSPAGAALTPPSQVGSQQHQGPPRSGGSPQAQHHHQGASVSPPWRPPGKLPAPAPREHSPQRQHANILHLAVRPGGSSGGGVESGGSAARASSLTPVPFRSQPFFALAAAAAAAAAAGVQQSGDGEGGESASPSNATPSVLARVLAELASPCAARRSRSTGPEAEDKAAGGSPSSPYEDVPGLGGSSALADDQVRAATVTAALAYPVARTVGLGLTAAQVVAMSKATRLSPVSMTPEDGTGDDAGMSGHTSQGATTARSGPGAAHHTTVVAVVSQTSGIEHPPGGVTGDHRGSSAAGGRDGAAGATAAAGAASHRAASAPRGVLHRPAPGHSINALRAASAGRGRGRSLLSRDASGAGVGGGGAGNNNRRRRPSGSAGGASETATFAGAGASGSTSGGGADNPAPAVVRSEGGPVQAAQGGQRQVQSAGGALSSTVGQMLGLLGQQGQ